MKFLNVHSSFQKITCSDNIFMIMGNKVCNIVTDCNDIARIERDDNTIFALDVEKVLDFIPDQPIFDLVITSPPYDIGKEYEKKVPLTQYIQWQKRIIGKLVPKVKDGGSICYELGTYISSDGESIPLDYVFLPIFKEFNLKLRNRIIWHFGHGLHSKTRFSGRYEVILWLTKGDDYTFNLDSVRIPSKYPGKRYYSGPKKGLLSGNPKGKNPEDVWEIPNVKSKHVEKTIHPCQFPVALAERLVLALSNEGDLVFDPFCGVATTGVAALLNNRNFWGCEIESKYVQIGKQRINDTINGTIKYRPDLPVYDNKRSKLSEVPEAWKKKDHENTDI